MKCSVSEVLLSSPWCIERMVPSSVRFIVWMAGKASSAPRAPPHRGHSSAPHRGGSPALKDVRSSEADSLESLENLAGVRCPSSAIAARSAASPSATYSGYRRCWLIRTPSFVTFPIESQSGGACGRAHLASESCVRSSTRRARPGQRARKAMDRRSVGSILYMATTTMNSGAATECGWSCPHRSKHGYPEREYRRHLLFYSSTQSMVSAPARGWQRRRPAHASAAWAVRLTHGTRRALPFVRLCFHVVMLGPRRPGRTGWPGTRARRGRRRLTMPATRERTRRCRTARGCPAPARSGRGPCTPAHGRSGRGWLRAGVCTGACRRR